MITIGQEEHDQHKWCINNTKEENVWIFSYEQDQGMQEDQSRTKRASCPHTSIWPMCVQGVMVHRTFKHP